MSKAKNPYWDEDLTETEVSDKDEDLWFLPPTDEDFDPEDPPLPRSENQALFPFNEWAKAEQMASADLARLCFDFGRLEERLRSSGEGARRRLALLEVSGLGWWMGDRLPADRLALWISMQIGATGADSQALARGAWAVRRLTSGPAPIGPDREEALAALIGLPKDTAIPERIRDAGDLLASLEALHPITQAAILFHLWRSDPSPAHDMEAAVLASRLAGSIAGRESFLPLSLTGFSGLVAQGSAEARLSAWILGAHQAVLAALLQMDRLRAWQIKAAEATRDLSGRTPPRLLQLLADWPSISAPMAEAETGASRAAVQRNLDMLIQKGLTREMTGQGRYRVWAALV